MMEGALIFLVGMIAGIILSPRKSVTIGELRKKVNDIIKNSDAKIIEKENILDQVEL